MYDFDYQAATSIEEAVSLLSQDGAARVLAGGTDLLVQLREGRKQATRLVDIKRIPELAEVHFQPEIGLRIGAAASCARICAHPAVRQVYPGLYDAVELIGGVQIQGRATLGGNLCNGSPAADAVPALIAYRAVAEIAGPGGRRELPVEQFVTGPGQTSLQVGECLVGLHLPLPASLAPGHDQTTVRSGGAYLRFIPRKEMDIAVAGAGAAVVLDESGRQIVRARVALSAVAPTPLFVQEAGEFLAGQEVSLQVLEEAAHLAQAAARPISDLRGSAAQRRQLVFVLTRRSLHHAVQRAQNHGS